MLKQFDKAIEDISENLCRSELKYCGPGLFSGKSGIALFLFYSSRFKANQKYSSIASNIIVEIFEEINTGFNFPTFCDGISGFGWTVEHLVKSNFLNRNDMQFLDDLDVVIYHQMIHQIRNGNWDFLHGALGNGLYFLERLHKSKSVDYLEELLLEVENKSTKNSAGEIAWFTSLKDGSIGCDLGLAHGIFSIIIFLSKLTQIERLAPKSTAILGGIDKYLMKNKLDFEKNGTHFPNFIYKESSSPKIEGRKIGWCYGDMGRAVGLYRLGQATQNSDIIKFAIKILEDSTDLRDLKKEGIKDYGVCHGTLGIAHIYRTMYNETMNKKFKNASEYWFYRTLELPEFDLNYQNKEWLTQENEYQDYGILGLSGAALILISTVYNKNLSWDKCLLLS